MEEIKTSNDRIRSNIARKTRHVRNYLRNKGQKHNKLLPIEFTHRYSDEDWNFNYKNVKFGYHSEALESEKTISSRIIQKCQKAYLREINLDKLPFQRLKRIIKNFKYLQSVVIDAGTSITMKSLNIIMLYLSCAKQYTILDENRFRTYFSASNHAFNPIHDSSSSYFKLATSLSSIFKLIPVFSQVEVSKYWCFRLSNVTYLTLKLAKAELDSSFLSGLSAVSSLQELEIIDWDIKSFKIFFARFIIIFSELTRLKKLRLKLIQEEDDELDWDCWIQNFQEKTNMNLTESIEILFQTQLFEEEDQAMLRSTEEENSHSRLIRWNLPRNVSKNSLVVSLYLSDYDMIDGGFDYIKNDRCSFTLNKEEGQIVITELALSANGIRKLHEDIIQYGPKIKKLLLSDYRPDNSLILSFNQSSASLTNLQELTFQVYEFKQASDEYYIPTEKIMTLASLETLEISCKYIDLREKRFFDIGTQINSLTKVLKGKTSLKYFTLNLGVNHNLANINTLIEALFSLNSFESFKFSFQLSKKLKTDELHLFLHDSNPKVYINYINYFNHQPTKILEMLLKRLKIYEDESSNFFFSKEHTKVTLTFNKKHINGDESKNLILIDSPNS